MGLGCPIMRLGNIHIHTAAFMKQALLKKQIFSGVWKQGSIVFREEMPETPDTADPLDTKAADGYNARKEMRPDCW